MDLFVVIVLRLVITLEVSRSSSITDSFTSIGILLSFTPGVDDIKLKDR